MARAARLGRRDRGARRRGAGLLAVDQRRLGAQRQLLRPPAGGPGRERDRRPRHARRLPAGADLLDARPADPDQLRRRARRAGDRRRGGRGDDGPPARHAGATQPGGGGEGGGDARGAAAARALHVAHARDRRADRRRGPLGVEAARGDRQPRRRGGAVRRHRARAERGHRPPRAQPRDLRGAGRRGVHLHLGGAVRGLARRPPGPLTDAVDLRLRPAHERPGLGQAGAARRVRRAVRGGGRGALRPARRARLGPRDQFRPAVEQRRAGELGVAEAVAHGVDRGIGRRRAAVERERELRGRLRQVADREAEQRAAAARDQRRHGGQQLARGGDHVRVGGGRLRQRPRARDAREVVEADVQRQRAAGPRVGPHPARDPVGEREQDGVERGGAVRPAAERVLRSEAAPARRRPHRPHLAMVRGRVEVAAGRAAEDGDQVGLAARGGVGDRADPARVQLPGAPLADAPERLDRERVQEGRLIRPCELEQPVGLRGAARHLRQQPRARHADGHRQADRLAHLAAQPRGDRRAGCRRSARARGRRGTPPRARAPRRAAPCGRTRRTARGSPRRTPRSGRGPPPPRGRGAAPARRACRRGRRRPRLVAGRHHHALADDQRPVAERGVVALLDGGEEGVGVGVQDRHEHMFASSASVTAGSGPRASRSRPRCATARGPCRAGGTRSRRPRTCGPASGRASSRRGSGPPRRARGRRARPRTCRPRAPSGGSGSASRSRRRARAPAR